MSKKTDNPLAVDSHEFDELKKIVDKLCKSCYGKGYSTRLYGIDDGYNVSGMRKHMLFCNCERGKQLQKDINENFTPKDGLSNHGLTF